MNAERPYAALRLGRRLLDRPFAVLAAGLILVVAVSAGMGIVEVFSLAAARLP